MDFLDPATKCFAIYHPIPKKSSSNNNDNSNNNSSGDNNTGKEIIWQSQHVLLASIQKKPNSYKLTLLENNRLVFD